MLFETEKIADEIAEILVEETEFILLQYKKIATRKTFKSLRGEGEGTDNRITAKLFSLESLFFIVSGRRAGAKLPVRKVGERFELVPELQEWVRAVGFTGNYYLLARKIAERGIKGIPVIALMLERARPRVIELIRKRTVDVVRDTVFEDVRKSFKGLN